MLQQVAVDLASDSVLRLIPTIMERRPGRSTKSVGNGGTDTPRSRPIAALFKARRPVRKSAPSYSATGRQSRPIGRLFEERRSASIWSGSGASYCARRSIGHSPDFQNPAKSAQRFDLEISTIGIWRLSIKIIQLRYALEAADAQNFSRTADEQVRPRCPGNGGY
jgi:hypothetical protein